MRGERGFMKTQWAMKENMCNVKCKYKYQGHKVTGRCEETGRQGRVREKQPELCIYQNFIKNQIVLYANVGVKEESE